MTQTHLGGDSSGSSPSGVGAPGRARIAARTLRTDRWWVEPAVTFTLLVAWLLYALIRTASQRYYFVEEYHYLSPFSSPCLSASCVPAARDFGTWFGEFPPFVPLGLLVLPFLLGFRLTCYYYRKAYYRSFWLSPPACAVAEPHAKYTGETRFPLILQNAHRYFFYAAIVVSLINTYDVIRAFHGKDGGFGIGLGTLIMLVNVVFLWAYTASCHSCRHLIGGRLQALLQAPGPLLAVDPGVEAQHPAHAARLDDARDPHGHGRLHRAGVGGRHHRSEAGELTWLLPTRRRRTGSSATSTTSSSSAPVAPVCAPLSPPARPVCAWP